MQRAGVGSARRVWFGCGGKGDDWSGLLGWLTTLAEIGGALGGAAVLVGGWRWLANRKEKRRQERLRRAFERPERMNARKVVGREDDVKAVREMLEAGGQGAILPVATVTGGGGIGKTTLARHYMAVYRDCYDRAELIRAASDAQLMGDLAALADRLERDNKPIEVKQRAHHALEMVSAATKRETWLMVFDNVENPDILRPWLPDGRNLHVLVTSRHPDWKAEGFETRPAGLLSPESAIALLEQEAGRGDDGFADLAEAVGYLPLALVQAGEWLADKPGQSAAGYLKRLNRLLDERITGSDDYDRSTGAVVRLTLQSLSKDARAVMGILVWFAPDEISLDAFDELGRRKGRINHGRWAIWRLWRIFFICLDEDRLTAVWQELRLKALIEDDAERDGVFRMHRVTQLVGRQALGKWARPDRATALLAAVYPSKTQENANWPLCRRLTPHLRALWDSGQAPRNEAMDFLLNQAGVFLRIIADYDGGLVLVEAGFEMAQDLYREEQHGYTSALQNLAFVRMRAGDLAGARRDMARVVALFEAHHPDTAELASSQDAMGEVLSQMARAGDAAHLPEAVKAHQRALALRRRLFGRQREPVAQSLNNLGMVRDAQGRGAAAARLVGASLAILRTVLPKNDTRLAYAAMNTGVCWLQAGRADLAEELLEEALKNLRGAFIEEPQHPDLRNAAGWLISCLLVRAAAGENREKNEKKARQLAEEFRFDWESAQAKARQYPYTPGQD